MTVLSCDHNAPVDFVFDPWRFVCRVLFFKDALDLSVKHWRSSSSERIFTNRYLVDYFHGKGELDCIVITALTIFVFKLSNIKVQVCGRVKVSAVPLNQLVAQFFKYSCRSLSQNF